MFKSILAFLIDAKNICWCIYYCLEIKQWIAHHDQFTCSMSLNSLILGGKNALLSNYDNIVKKIPIWFLDFENLIPYDIIKKRYVLNPATYAKNWSPPTPQASKWKGSYFDVNGISDGQSFQISSSLISLFKKDQYRNLSNKYK